MYTPSDIKSSARKIYSGKRELQNKENRLKSEIENVESWWHGNAGKSFVQGYRETEREINRIYSDIDNLEGALGRLASEVDRADDERRRRIAEEKKRLEQSKSKKR